MEGVFKSDFRLEHTGPGAVFYFKGPAIFSNLLSFKNKLYKLQNESPLVLDFSQCKFVDHTFWNLLTNLKGKETLPPSL